MLRIVYPPRCLSCGDLVESDFGLCGLCWRDTSFIGSTICDSCGTPLPADTQSGPLFCDQCLKEPRPWEKGRAAVLYKDVGRKLVLQLKHGDRTDIAAQASKWMLSAIQDVLSPEILIVPIPLHWQRFLKRRYNQAARLAEGISKNSGSQYCPDALLRARRTLSLDGADILERQKRIFGAFRVNPRYASRIYGRPILLVDDVFTSGTTFSEAARVLRAASSGPVHVIALARVAIET